MTTATNLLQIVAIWKICHRFLQNEGFRARKGLSSIRNLHFGGIGTSVNAYIRSFQNEDMTMTTVTNLPQIVAKWRFPSSQRLLRTRKHSFWRDLPPIFPKWTFPSSQRLPWTWKRSFWKICHRFLQNAGFRARRGFSGLGNFHFGEICDRSFQNEGFRARRGFSGFGDFHFGDLPQISPK